MKPITKYLCDKCENSYDTEAECLKCESSHATSVEIIEQSYDQYTYIPKVTYPESVIIRMSDGTSHHYKHSSI